MLWVVLWVVPPAWAMAPDRPTEIDIIVVLSSDKPLYQRAFGSLQQSLPVDAHIVSYALSDWHNRAAGDLSNPPPLLIAVGTQAAEAILSSGVESPLLSIMVPSTTYQKLLMRYPAGENQTGGGQRAAIFMDQPPERQINFAKLIAPHAKTYGTLFDNTSQQLVAGLSQAAKAQSVAFKSRHLVDSDNPLKVLKKMYREIDMFISVPSQFMFNRSTAKWMLYLSLRNKKPLLGFSEDFVKAGALGAVYSTPEDIAREAGEWISEYQKSGQCTSASKFPRYFKVSVNQDVADAFNLTLDAEDVLKWELDKLELNQ